VIVSLVGSPLARPFRAYRNLNPSAELHPSLKRSAYPTSVTSNSNVFDG
jgi:hypothetical protein